MKKLITLKQLEDAVRRQEMKEEEGKREKMYIPIKKKTHAKASASAINLYENTPFT